MLLVTRQEWKKTKTRDRLTEWSKSRGEGGSLFSRILLTVTEIQSREREREREKERERENTGKGIVCLA